MSFVNLIKKKLRLLHLTTPPLLSRSALPRP